MEEWANMAARPKAVADLVREPIQSFPNIADFQLQCESSPPEPPTDISSFVDISRYRWSSLMHTTVFIFRLLDNFQLKDRSRSTWNRQPLLAVEVLRADRLWILIFQKRHLANEIKYLQAKKKSWRPPLISQLDLFLDLDGIVRCGG